jgi:hypothetical protein
MNSGHVAEELVFTALLVIVLDVLPGRVPLFPRQQRERWPSGAVAAPGLSPLGSSGYGMVNRTDRDDVARAATMWPT